MNCTVYEVSDIPVAREDRLTDFPEDCWFMEQVADSCQPITDEGSRAFEFEQLEDLCGFSYNAENETLVITRDSIVRYFDDMAKSISKMVAELNAKDISVSDLASEATEVSHLIHRIHDVYDEENGYYICETRQGRTCLVTMDCFMRDLYREFRDESLTQITLYAGGTVGYRY